MAVRGDIEVGARARAPPSRPRDAAALRRRARAGRRAGGTRSRDHGASALDRLRDARLILFDRTSSYYELTNALFRPAGSLPSGVLELDNIDAAKQMVLAGLGIALLPTTAVARELRDGTLRRVDLVGTPPIERRIVAVRRLTTSAGRSAATAFWTCSSRHTSRRLRCAT